MKRIFVPLVFLIGVATFNLQAQRDVLPAGGDFSSSGGSVAFSIGQIGYTYLTGESGSASLGVQQPNTFNIVATDDPVPALAMTLYPNPADQFVYVDLKEENALEQFEGLQIRLYDLQGQLIAEKEMTDKVTRFPLVDLSDALYVLQICQGQKMITSFKLFKSN